MIDWRCQAAPHAWHVTSPHIGEDEGVFEQLRFLVNVHGLGRVVLIAHENCAFYSERLHVSSLQLETQQRDNMKKAVQRVRSLSRSLSVNAFFARKHEKGVIQFESVEL
jgi:hypothetical protein